MQEDSQPVRRWNPWPVSIVAFFVVAILGCVSFVAFCSLHPSELVAPDYYEQELRFQARMDSRDHARQLGPQASVSFDASAGAIRVRVPGRELNPSGTIQLYRPSAAGLDRQVPLHLDPGGQQIITVAGLDPGLWKVRVSWRAGDREYFIDEPVVLGQATERAKAP